MGRPELLFARLSDIRVVGILAQNKSHFIRVYVDGVAVTKSGGKKGVPLLRWEKEHKFEFRPSLKVTIKLFRRSMSPLRRPHFIGQHTCNVTQLLENNFELELMDDSTGRSIDTRLTVKFTIIDDLGNDIMKRADDDLAAAGFNNTTTASTSPQIDDETAISRVEGDAVKVLGSCVVPLGKLLVKVTDNTADVNPLLKASWVVLSTTYKAVQNQILQEGSVVSLAKTLREMLGVAGEVKDLKLIEGTTDVIRDIGRVSLEITSLIDECLRHSFGAITDEMETRISKYKETCQFLLKQFRTRLQIEKGEDIKINDKSLENQIFAWLKAPDSSSSYSDARSKYQEGTGVWFIDGEIFSKWKNDEASFLPVYGKPGCGKTILSSSIISHVDNICQGKPSCAYAYFFFDGRNEQKELKLLDGLIRSLIQQFVYQCGGIPPRLVELYEQRHQPISTETLGDLLLHILHSFGHAYIVIDALDECVDRWALLKWVQKIADAKIDNLHMLVTCRLEEEITSFIASFEPLSISMDEDHMNHDMEVYLDAIIKDGWLKEWPETVQSQIKSALMEKAQGMFQWFALQLGELQQCPNEAELELQLNRLPKDLNETYFRILGKIPEQRRTVTKVLLRWTAFSERPPSLEELGEVAAFEFNEGVPKYDPRRKTGTRMVLATCANLIVESEGYVKLSHPSLKEYLISEDMTMEISYFGISEKLSHSFIAQICLSYLLRFDSLESLSDDTLPDFPLARYAAENWFFHVRLEGNENSPVVQNLIMALFKHEMSLTNWIRLYDPDHPSKDSEILNSVTSVPNALYYASLLGFPDVVQGLLEGDTSHNAMHGWDINSTLERGRTALEAACREGHVDVVDMLLDRGADVNAGIGAALVSASERGHIQIVQMLLDRGADVNARGKYGTALRAASGGGHIDIVQLLLDYGADVNAHSESGDTALIDAAVRGDDAVVRLLLARGAEVNAMGRLHGAALHAAFVRGHTAVLQALLDQGADVDAEDGKHGSALQTASNAGQEAVAEMLLKAQRDALKLEKDSNTGQEPRVQERESLHKPDVPPVPLELEIEFMPRQNEGIKRDVPPVPLSLEIEFIPVRQDEGIQRDSPPVPPSLETDFISVRQNGRTRRDVPPVPLSLEIGFVPVQQDEGTRRGARPVPLVLEIGFMPAHQDEGVSNEPPPVPLGIDVTLRSNDGEME